MRNGETEKAIKCTAYNGRLGGGQRIRNLNVKENINRLTRT